MLVVGVLPSRTERSGATAFAFAPAFALAGPAALRVAVPRLAVCVAIFFSLQARSRILGSRAQCRFTPTVMNCSIATTPSSGSTWALSSRLCEPWLWAMVRSEEHTSELQSLMRISYAVFCLKKKNTNRTQEIKHTIKLTLIHHK